MKAKVHVTTFRPKENQGTVFVVGTMDLEVKKTVMPLVYQNGCISGEIIQNQIVESVILAGREYVVREGGYGSDFHKSGAKYSVAIPHEVAEDLKPRCSCCGQIIKK
jgi:hypothetical protein